jgi:hypothetical protein
LSFGLCQRGLLTGGPKVRILPGEGFAVVVLEQSAEPLAAHNLARRERRDALRHGVIDPGDRERNVAASLMRPFGGEFTDPQPHPDCTFDIGVRIG